MSVVVVTGTGTEIGKTTFAAALAVAWGRTGARVAAVKPIESGDGSDGRTLGQVSTFHVTRFQSPYLLPHPVSPHLAARKVGVTIEVEKVIASLAEVRSEADGVIVELAGGLFSPLAPSVTNADLVAALAPDTTLLVAPDRLGVLHDVAATTRAAVRIAFAGIVLSAPALPDASTGTNAEELRLVTDVPVLAVLPRAPVEMLALELADVLRAVARAK